MSDTRTCPQCGFACDETHNFCPSCAYPISKIAGQKGDPWVGKVLAGTYVILELVGVGGMGRVYRAEQSNLGRTVAVKIVHPHLVGDENSSARFITEARATSALNHPNSVSVYDFGRTDDGQFFLVMEFLRGKDLAKVQYEEGVLPFRRIVSILTQVLAALAEAHVHGIIHRDLKPENIVLEPSRSGVDFVKVVDFGLAKMKVTALPSITSPGIVCGTPEYMSPEQGRGDVLDARTDLYAVGVIFFQLLTTHLPFEADSPTATVLLHMTEPVPDPRLRAPGRAIADSLADVCMMALAKEPAHRFGDADEFAEALKDALKMPEESPASVRAAVCSVCRAANSARQKFCGECGAPLARALPTDAPSELALAPSPPSASLETALVADAPTHAPLPLVERDLDLQWLDSRRADARSGLRVAHLVAELGMGKSRLLAEFAERCSRAGDVVVQLTPHPSHAPVSEHGLQQLISGLLGARSEPSLRTALASAPGLARVGYMAMQGVSNNVHLPSDTKPALSRTERRDSIGALVDWCWAQAESRAGAGTVVVLVDDVQATDGATLAVTDAWLHGRREPGAQRGLVVYAHLPDDSRAEANEQPIRRMIGLSLTGAEDLMGGNALPPGASALSRGIPPLYVEHARRFVNEQTGIPPARLGDLIARRIERLDTAARKTLQAIAVFGDMTSTSILRRMLPEVLSVTDAAARLVRMGFVRSVRTPQGTVLAVSHPLLRDLVLAEVPSEARRALHEAALRADDEHVLPLAARAAHEAQAHNAFQALLLLDRVSAEALERDDTALQVGSLRAAMQLLRSEISRGTLDAPEDALVLFALKLADALAGSEQYEGAEGTLREVMDMGVASAQDRVRILARLSEVASARGRPDEARKYGEESESLRVRIALADGARASARARGT